MERKKNSEKKFMHISLAHYEKLIDMLYFYTGIADADVPDHDGLSSKKE